MGRERGRERKILYAVSLLSYLISMTAQHLVRSCSISFSFAKLQGLFSLNRTTIHNQEHRCRMNFAGVWSENTSVNNTNLLYTAWPSSKLCYGPSARISYLAVEIKNYTCLKAQASYLRRKYKHNINKCKSTSHGQYALNGSCVLHPSFPSGIS